MNNNNTNKKYFKEILSNNITKSPKFILHDETLEVMGSFEDEKYIGFECRSKLNSIGCKTCGVITERIKDRKITYPLYGMINKKPVLLKLHKKLFYCVDCKVSTMEHPIDTRAYAQKTDTFIDMILGDLKEQTTYSTISRRYKISVSNVIFHFDKYRIVAEQQDYSNIKHIAVDEVRFIPTSGKYQFVIMDHTTGNVVDILENRYGSSVKAYIEKYLPHIEVMSQDFWDPYRNAVKDLKHPVTIIADKFHLARFACWGFNRTRVNLQKSTGLKLGKSWKLQTKSRHRLDAVGKMKADAVVNQHATLTAAYKAKNYFFAILRMTSAAEYEIHIQKWLRYIKAHHLTEFYFIETTLINWNTEIINMYNSTYSNGSIERINRTIKQAKNIAYGFKNLARATDLIKLRTSA